MTIPMTRNPTRHDPTMHALTAHGADTTELTIDDLWNMAGESRRLLATEPDVDRSRRQQLLTELTEVDLELERISLRTVGEPGGALDLPRLAECSDRLGRLRREWRGRPTTASEGPA